MRASPAARPDAIRRHNLSLVLDHIHRDGALTRAELTQRLTVSRSTIGALVTDLVDLGLVTESVPSGNDRAGRPSHVVRPAPDGPYVLAVDLDVTGVSAAAVGIGGAVLARRSAEWSKQGPPTPKRAVAVIARLLAEVQQAHTGRAVGIGVSVPGTVDHDTGVVSNAPNLDWHAVPFGPMLSSRAPIDLPVHLGNDADLGVLAEHRRGNGRGVDELVLIMGRVGVGAGIMVDGKLLHGRYGRAGEIGHNIVDGRGPRCHCGRRGCLETYVGDAALLDLAGRAGPPTTPAVATLFNDARGGNKQAMTAVRKVAASLGHGIAALVNTIDPQRVILAGSSTHVLDIAHDELLGGLRRNVFGEGPDVELAPPALGADLALVGAAEIAFGSLLTDPVGAVRALAG
ncbi:MAG: ROK family protein [Jatrophihabitans sp.]|uniref:ROK family protein n=1 Tax=Jatrophihabitans sp. TaxID=1932789 RepID=UPI003F7DF6F7